jgi:hypothetical protein
MSVNFFNWIRDGVKQSVLLGVSDAIETLGTPADPKSMHPNIAALMKGSEGSTARANVAAAPSTNNASRKRLGRSLRDIEPAPNTNS